MQRLISRRLRPNCTTFRLIAASAFWLCSQSEVNAQAHRIDGSAPGLVDSGAPPFAILSQESLGLNSPPTDFSLLPDGRLLVVASQQLALGDGVRWENFRQSPDDPLIAGLGVAVDEDGAIYTGSSKGFGRVEFIGNNFWRLVPVASSPSGNGLDRTIPRAAIAADNQWFWHSRSGAFISWKPGQPARVAGHSDDLEHVFSLDGQLYLSDRNQGDLYRVEPGKKERLRPSGETSPDASITSSLPFDEDCLLVGTHGQGLQLFYADKTVPFPVSSAVVRHSRINDLCAAEGGIFAAAVDNYGIVFFDRKGRTIQTLTRALDHRLSGVKRLLRAPGGAIWGLLDRGIMRVEFPSSISYFEPIVGTGVNAAHPYRLDGKLWFLADGKVKRAVYDNDGHLSRLETDMPPNVYAFTFSSALGLPTIGTQKGAFFRNDSGWVPFAPHTKNLRILESTPRDGRWIYAARGEIGWLRRTPEGIETERILALPLPDAYNSETDRDGTIWIEIGSGRFGRISFKERQPVFDAYDSSHGIPDSWAQVFKIDGVVGFNVSQQILRFDETANRFVPDYDLERKTSLSEIYGRPGMDSAGRLWIATLTGVKVLEKDGEKWRLLPLKVSPRLRPYYFTFEPTGVVWMHSERRLERYDPQIAAPSAIPLRALITQVNVAGGNRSFFPSDGNIPELDYTENSLVVHFSAPGHPFRTPVTFEVNLEGTNSDWTSTGSSGTAVFNRLKEGSYVLRVRPRVDRVVGDEAVLALSIRPPWYRSTLAYAGYATSALGLLFFAAWIASYLERRETARLEKLVSERTQELNTSRDRLAVQVDEIRMLSQAIEQSPVAVFITQLNGTIVFANPRACESSGYSCAELINQNMSVLRAAPAGQDGATAKLTDAMETGTPWRGQLANRHKDGRILQVRTMIAPVRATDGLVRHHLILEEDITEWLSDQDRRHRLEAQLFQAQKLESIGTLAGGIAHDFNNILTGILGYCELARLAARGNPDVVNELEEVFSAGRRAKDLIAQILTFSRKSNAQLLPIDLVEPVTDALKLFRTTAPSTLQIVSRTESGRVKADPTQIQQVVLNLCTNALHAMQNRAGILSVSVQRITADQALAAEIPNLSPGAWMRLSVADNGRGMDAATLERIFDPFFTTKKHGEGTGLGLSIVQSIVAAHKAPFRVRSTPDMGTTFEIFFALTTDDCPDVLDNTPVPRGARQEIIVVDDERAVATFAAARLSQLGFSPTMFGEPRAALDAFKAFPQRFDAIVTDLTMPELTGLELIKQIRDLGRVIPAVIITGYGSDSVRTSIDALPRCIVLEKPFSGEELARALDQVLNRTRTVIQM